MNNHPKFHEGLDLMVKSAGLLSLCFFGAMAIASAAEIKPQSSGATSNTRIRPASVVASFNQGALLLHAGKYEEAAKAFAEAVKGDPRAPGARINLGVALWALADYPNALTQLNEALKLYPGNAYALSQRALCKQALKDYAGSIADFDHALKTNPRNATLFSNRGVSKMESGDLDGARADFYTALELKPNDALVLNNLQVLDFGKILSERMKRRQAAVEKVLKNMGVINLNGNSAARNPKPGAAVDPQSAAVPANENDAPTPAEIAYAHYDAACRLLGGAKYAEAVHELDKAIQNHPDAEYYLSRSSAHTQLGNTKLALADCNSAIQLEPTDPNAFLTRCCAHFELGDSEAALSDGNQAILLDSQATEDSKVTHAEALYLNRGRAHYKLRDLDNALSDFNKAIELNPLYASAFHNRAIAHIESKNQKEAVSDLLQAAKLYESQGNVKAAAECSAEAQRLSAKIKS